MADFISQNEVDKLNVRQLEERVREHLGNQPGNEVAKKSPSRTYGCPECKLIVHTKTEARLLCEECNEKLKLSD
jgi:uncharacterized protein YlaI